MYTSRHNRDAIIIDWRFNTPTQFIIKFIGVSINIFDNMQDWTDISRQQLLLYTTVSSSSSNYT